MAEEQSPKQKTEAASSEAKAEMLIDMPEGGDLNLDTAANITSAALTRLVLIAGEAESGKTTLLATIYEKFNEGPFAGLLFAGSRTLVGWERRCHLARVASGAERADTERTLGLQQRLLHLRVRNKDLESPIQDVLFTDLSGEVFKLIRDSTPECEKFGVLKRADHLVLLLDGARLASAATRHDALNSSAALLRSCIDAGMIGAQTFLDVVFSKYDLLVGTSGSTKAFLNEAVNTIKSRFEGKLGRLRFHNIAARPEAPEIEFAFGISDLLVSWVNESPYLVNHLVLPMEFPSKMSEFDKYFRVRFPELTVIAPWK